MSEFTRYPWSMGAFLGLGREFSPLWGWRAALRINHNKSRNVRSCESHKTYGWYNVGLFGDVTFDVTDVFRKSHTIHKDSLPNYRPPRFNLKAFAGLGLAYTWRFTNVKL